MSNNIIFDLDNTLIWGENISPQAIDVLERSKKDFDSTILWTYSCEENFMPKGIKHDIIKYFNGLIFLYPNQNDKQTVYDFIKYENNKEIRREKIFTKSPYKNLAILGNPKDYVFIENRVITPEDYILLGDKVIFGQPTLGRPHNRVVEVEPFGGPKGHDLMSAYALALKKF